MSEFDSESIPKAKDDALRQIVEGLPQDKIHVTHTKEIVWIERWKYERSKRTIDKKH